MATNLTIDPESLEAAHKIGGQKTRESTVTEALKEYIQRREQLRILELFGTVDYDSDYDYKAQRAHA